MKDIEERILKDGKIIDNDIICVDSFLNHQIDVAFLRDFARDCKKYFKNVRIDRVLTCETSGIAIAFAVAQEYGDIPCVFAKKSKTKNTVSNLYRSTVKSFTRGQTNEITISENYLRKGENVLIVDDFLADGNAAFGLLDLCAQAEANAIGVAVVIEKAFQAGHKRLVEAGVNVFAGASIKAFENNKPIF